MPHRVIKSIDGRRGGALLMIGLAFVVYGWGHLRPSEGRALALSWLPEWFSNVHLGTGVIVLAGLTVVCALVSRFSRHLLAVGFLLAFVQAGVLAVVYGIAWWPEGLLPDPAVSVLFLVFGGIIFSISGLDEGGRQPLTPAARAAVQAAAAAQRGDDEGAP